MRSATLGTKDVKITVTNEEDPGAVTLSHLQPRVGVADNGQRSPTLTATYPASPGSGLG